MQSGPVIAAVLEGGMAVEVVRKWLEQPDQKVTSGYNTW